MGSAARLDSQCVRSMEEALLTFGGAAAPCAAARCGLMAAMAARCPGERDCGRPPTFQEAVEVK